MDAVNNTVYSVPVVPVKSVVIGIRMGSHLLKYVILGRKY
jgi:hypothetical protein